MQVDLEKYRVIHTKNREFLVLRSQTGTPIEGRLKDVPENLKAARFFTTVCGEKIIVHVIEQTQRYIIKGIFHVKYIK